MKQEKLTRVLPITDIHNHTGFYRYGNILIAGSLEFENVNILFLYNVNILFLYYANFLKKLEAFMSCFFFKFINFKTNFSKNWIQNWFWNDNNHNDKKYGGKFGKVNMLTLKLVFQFCTVHKTDLHIAISKWKERENTFILHLVCLNAQFQ